MTKIFLGGSRRMSRLTDAVRARIDNIIKDGLEVLVGDANGADKVFQKYLAEHKYSKVMVFCTAECRNNVSGWQTRRVGSDRRTRDFKFYTAKDLAMCREADYGLMLWDGRSVGTLNNIVNLANDKKKVVVYFAPKKDFTTVRSVEDLKKLLNRCAREDILKFQKRLNLSTTTRPNQTELHFGT